VNQIITRIKKNLTALGALLFISAILTSVLNPAYTKAASTSLTAMPRISFTFDDGLTSAYTNAVPIMQKYALPATEYIPTGCMGTTNYCPENPSANYMSWSQVQALQNTYGWEIGSHTVDTPCLASSAETDPNDCPNATPLTTAQIDTELVNSKSTLASYGIKAVDFAPPYGDYNANVIAQVAKYYASMRQFQNTANNTNGWPYSDYFLQDYPVLQTTTPVSSVETAINNAITNKQWLILTFHDVVANPSSNPDDDQYGTSELNQIAAYVQTKEAAGLISATTVNNGLVNSNTNLLPNSSFSAGITDGWTTDAPSTITADSGNNGSYPNPQYSVKITSGTSTGHLFSPKFTVNPSTSYAVKSFLNLESVNSGGGVGYYIDEYNAQGNWISGQYLKQETGQFAEDMNFNYTPSSSSVAFASLQYIVFGSGINGYVANPQIFPTTSTTQTDLLPNGNFAAGIADGWTTDNSTAIVADSNNNGAPDNPRYSVSLNSPSSSSNAHLFSPQVAVTSANSYSISNWVNIKKLTSGCVGFYIDEYNSSGQWISGQYMATDTTMGPNYVGFTYKPSSSNVAKAALQVIVVGNGGIQAYYDDAQWSPGS
jgi:peptidoglycan/xylan/chitin deacetylase (PgdA/CDA1 family)